MQRFKIISQLRRNICFYGRNLIPRPRKKRYLAHCQCTGETPSPSQTQPENVVAKMNITFGTLVLLVLGTHIRW